MCAPSQSQTKLRNLGWVGGGAYPQFQGCGAGVCAPLPHLPLRFDSIAIPCSLVVAKLICNSCSPYPPPPDSEKLKESPRLLPCLAYDIGLEMNKKKYKKQGKPMPNFFLRCVRVVVFFVIFLFCFFFQHFFFQILSPAPSPSYGLCCFYEHWADSDSHCNCCAPPLPSHGNLPKASRGRQGNSKLIVRNNLFECTTLLKNEVIEYGKWVSKMA